jgi:hypothetical protein
MKLANLSKILKCAGNDDAITMKSEDNGDTITFMFESPSERCLRDAPHRPPPTRCPPPPLARHAQPTRILPGLPRLQTRSG